ncbi:MAG: gephyrin-like molybdotransferase Glp [Parvularculaceae bacterium]
MFDIETARKIIVESATPLPAEKVGLDTLAGRVAAEDVRAAITQPPFRASAMDGYAVRFEDARRAGATLKVIGEIAAGASVSPEIGPSQAARIFTGGVLPEGADHVIIQEDVSRDGDAIIVERDQPAARNIRAAGIDFEAGDTLAPEGARLNAIHASLFAAANLSAICVYARPRVAVFANGDELAEPGATLAPGQIVNSTHYALRCLAERWGAQAGYAGCARDTIDDVKRLFECAAGADVIVPLGGASVGDYDFVKQAFAELGGTLLFENVAVKPGKPVWFGALDDACVLGLPGNPASALVCAVIFLAPLVEAMQGLAPRAALPLQRARLTSSLQKNGARPALIRARTCLDEDGALYVCPRAKQDSALLKPFADSNSLIFRPADAPALDAGGVCEIILFDPAEFSI